MDDLASVWQTTSAALATAGLDAALVGGFAVSVRTEPRFTRDVDLAVAVADDDQAESFVHQLRLDGHEVYATVEQEAAGRLATARVRLHGGGLLDVLFASSGIEPEIVASSEPLEVLSGTTIPVARVGHLLVLKLLARDDTTRPQDTADLRALLGVASTDDLELADQGCALVEARGYARGRDLRAALADALG